MSYKLYTDKTNKFQCTVEVQGTSLGNSQARIILETNNDMSYLFRGRLYDNGICEFNLPKLKNILSEGDKGVLKLEIIADDVHFEPWNSEFNVVSDKKVNVIVQEQAIIEKPKIVVNQISLDIVKDEPKQQVSKIEEQKQTVQKTDEPKKEEILESAKIEEGRPKKTFKLTKSQMEMILNRTK
jgi:hypothetical protein